MPPARHAAALVLALLVCCAPEAPSPAPPPAPLGASPPAAAPPPQAPAPVTAIEVEAAPAAPRDPQALYAACQERVELPQQAGECRSDADCIAGGCSQEICTTREAMAGLMSTCEILPCFQVLESCGCHDGACTWTLGQKDGAAPVPVPGSLAAPPAAAGG